MGWDRSHSSLDALFWPRLCLLFCHFRCRLCPMSHSLGRECAAFPSNGSSMLILVCVTLTITGIDFLYWRFLRQDCTALPDTAKGKLMEIFGFSKEWEVSGVWKTGETGCCTRGLSFLSVRSKRVFLGLEKN